MWAHLPPSGGEITVHAQRPVVARRRLQNLLQHCSGISISPMTRTAAIDVIERQELWCVFAATNADTTKFIEYLVS